MNKIIVCVVALCSSVTVWAASFNMTTTRPTCNGGSWSVSGSTYTCNGSISLASGDIITSGSGSAITVVANNGGITLAGSNAIGTSSAAVNLQTTFGTLASSGSGTVIYGNLVAATGAINLTNTVLNGSITTSGTVSISGGSVSGNVIGSNGVTTTSGPTIGGSVTANSGSISLSGGSVAGSVTSSCCGVTTNNTNLSNGISSSNNTVTINGGTVSGPISSSGGSGVVINNATVSSGSISASNVGITINNSTIGSPASAVDITGNNTVNISNGSNVYGDVVAGGWSTALNIDNSSTVYGVCQSDSNSVSSPPQYPRCANTVPMAEWRMDESSWNGTANEVRDSVGSYHGFAARAAGSTTVPTTATGSPAYTSSSSGLTTCRYGEFDRTSSPVRTYSYVQLGSFPTLPAQFTFAGWIRTTDRSASGQRILVNDDNDNGWGFSVGDTTAGTVRLFNRNISNSGSVSGGGVNGNCGVFCIDSDNVIANNTWYFVAATVDTATKDVTLYVFNTSGTRLDRTTGKYSGNWANGTGAVAIGGETAASSEGVQTGFHFRGNIDELKVYGSALTETALKGELARARSCTTPVNHYELRLPSPSIACTLNTVTVAACADSAVPCSNYVSAVGGQTAVLGTSAGSLASTTVTFNSGGLATTTLSYPAATDGASATVSLSNETAPAQTARVCCVGTSCSVANSCSTTFRTAGFIFSDTAGGVSATIATQVAGTSSADYYLRAVRTNTTTQACEAALAGPNAVNFAYECNNPTTCAGSNLLSINGGAVTTIARNNSGSVSTYTSVNLAFDSNGNAPFKINYSDVGRITLWANKAANSSPGLLATLTGSSGQFVVRPAGFSVDTILRTSDSTANPAATNSGGTKFVRAGDGANSLSQFTATVKSLTSTGAVTPNFGRETTPESVTLTPTRGDSAVLVNDGVMYLDGAAGGIVPGSTFSSGIAVPTKLGWSEVGVMTLRPSLTSANYLSSGAVAVTGSSTTSIGRFYPYQFVLVSGSVADLCNNTSSNKFSYMEQPFSLKPLIEARNSRNDRTRNYLGTYVKGTVGYAAENLNNGTDLSARLSGTGGSWNEGQFTLPDRGATFARAAGAAVDGPFANLIFGARVTDSDADTSGPVMASLDMNPATSGVCSGVGCTYKQIAAETVMYYGRARITNAQGSELLDLPMPFVLESWGGNAIGWVLRNDDRCTGASDAVTLQRRDNLPPAAAVCTSNTCVNTCVQDTGSPGESGAGCGALAADARRYRDATAADSPGALSFKGNFNLWLRAPGNGNQGRVWVVSTVPTWLQFNWTGTVASPIGLAVFGQMPSGRVIYRRESY